MKLQYLNDSFSHLGGIAYTVKKPTFLSEIMLAHAPVIVLPFEIK